jgi:hypothetical protein
MSIYVSFLLYSTNTTYKSIDILMLAIFFVVTPNFEAKNDTGFLSKSKL